MKERVGMHNPQIADSALIRANKRAQEIVLGGQYTQEGCMPSDKKITRRLESVTAIVGGEEIDITEDLISARLPQFPALNEQLSMFPDELLDVDDIEFPGESVVVARPGVLGDEYEKIKALRSDISDISGEVERYLSHFIIIKGGKPTSSFGRNVDILRQSTHLTDGHTDMHKARADILRLVDDCHILKQHNAIKHNAKLQPYGTSGKVYRTRNTLEYSRQPSGPMYSENRGVKITWTEKDFLRLRSQFEELRGHIETLIKHSEPERYVKAMRAK